MQTGFSRLRAHLNSWQDRQRLVDLAHQVAVHAHPTPGQQPVVLFNASTRLTDLSQNAAFSLLTGWSLRLAGVPVVNFTCQSGMSHCVLGTNRDDFTTPPPCHSCIRQTERLYTGAQVQPFAYAPDTNLSAALQALPVTALMDFEYPCLPGKAPIPLGRLVLPSIRWALRRYTLPDDEPTRYLLREYMHSAYHVAREFDAFLETANPSAAVIFNGIMFPEAAARWVARQRDLTTYTHEVGFRRLSAFFSAGQATAYPMDIPADFELDEAQNAHLDAYLEQRFQGKFTMAGIQFWPEMRGLDQAFLQKAAGFRQIVPVFTNVAYDTSQVHANVVFPHMFAWLDLVLEIIRTHPETLFVIRAHPDEMRLGTKKISQESVRDWVMQNGVAELPNVVFIDPTEFISSYELIQRARFAIVYNSSIGLEAALMGKVVLCGGKARYTQYPTVYFPETQEGFRQKAEEFLAAGDLAIPDEFQRNARRFVYYQLYRASLPFERYLETLPRMGFVRLQSFSWRDLLPERSPTMSILHNGILNGQPFLLGEGL